MSKLSTKKGFTLIEIMVSVSIFAVIMLMVSSTIYSVFDSNRKSQSLRSVMDNLNFSLEAMTRTIRFGIGYQCNTSFMAPPGTANCASGGSSIVLTDSSGNRVGYELNNNRIRKYVNGVYSYITSTDVTIDKLSFYVVGADNLTSGDTLQPKVVVVVGGYAGPKPSSRSSFILQTTISQRIIDSQ